MKTTFKTFLIDNVGYGNNITVKKFYGRDLTNITNEDMYVDDNIPRHELSAYKDINKLSVKDCQNLESMKGCPTKLTTLEFQDCPSLTTLEYSPKEISRYVIGSSSIRDLTGISPVITNLDIIECYHLTSFKGIKTVHELTTYYTPHIKTLKHLWEANIIGKLDICNTKSNEAEDMIHKAAEILWYYKRKGEKNFLKVIKDARENEVEEYFK